MAASDLQDRLEYLVSYASQLIFISSEVSRQSNVLDSYIAHSTEQIEIALLTASTMTPLAKYRENLYRQLISQTKSADFNRPLNQLLADLNLHDGPIIISITKGEDLPPKLVKELWELVLQSRFTNNKQHLNVLIFAEEIWSRDSKLQLTSKSGDKPLLLNTINSVQLLQNEMSSDLDKLIAAKRQKFAERLRQRAEKPAIQKPLLTRKPVIASFIVIFLTIFMGLVSWQYPEHFLWLSPHSDRVESSQATAVIVPAEKLETIVNKSVIQTNITPKIMEKETTEEKTVVVNPEQNTESTSTPSHQADLLVTDWHHAIEQVEQRSAKFLMDKTESEKIQTSQNSTEDRISNDKEMVKEIESEHLSPAQSTSPTSLKVIEGTTENQPNTGSSFQPLPNSINLKGGGYFIQISAMADDAVLKKVVDDNRFSSDLWIYDTQRFGGKWHVLLFNQVYPSLDAAKAALQTLPPDLVQQNPFIKSAATIEKEIAVNIP